MTDPIPASTDDSADAHFMRLALAQARAAAQAGEVPIGAVLVSATGELLASAHNAPIALCDPTAHAELLALRQGAQALGNYRLDGCTLYVTAEPCAMCAGAALHARLARVVYATAEPKTGAAGSQIDVFGQPALNAHTTVQGGLLAGEAQALLRAFFSQQRQRAEAARPPRLRDDAVRAPSAAFHAAFDALGWPSRAREWLQDGAAPAPQSAQNQDARAQSGELQAFGHAITLPDQAQAKPATPPTAWRMHAVHRPQDLAPGTPAALLIHGWADHGWVWRDWARALNASGWRVLVPDLLGAGQSDKPKRDGRLNPAEQMLALQALLARLHWADARQRVLVADASLAPLLAASGVAQSASTLLWLQAPAIGAPAGNKPCKASTPQDPAALLALLATEPDAVNSSGYAQATARKQAASAAYPDKGHLTLCRSWLQALSASASASHTDTGAATGTEVGTPLGAEQATFHWPNGQAAPQRLPPSGTHPGDPAQLPDALHRPAIDRLRDAPAFGRIWSWSPAAAQWFTDLA